MELIEVDNNDSEESFSGNEEDEQSGENAKNKGKAPIVVLVCKVCKKYAYDVGLKGDICMDCLMKPCLYCKMPDHTTVTCPRQARNKNTRNAVEYAFDRQINPRIPGIKPTYVIPDQLICEGITGRSSQITCLEFHPTKINILLSGDMEGKLVYWDFRKVNEMVSYGSNRFKLNNMKFNPRNDGIVYAASSDGTVSCTDLATGDALRLIYNLRGSQTAKYGLDINPEKSVVLVADNYGYLYMVDIRSNDLTSRPILIHERGSTVVGLHCHPVQPDLLLSCASDCYARIWDIRRIQEASSIYDLAHSQSVNSAYFSPVSGSKILTTTQDNNLCIWDSIFGDMDSPSREIIHSHGYGPNMTPFQAEWDPKDPFESLAVIGRLRSEIYDGAALHPIDFIDVSTGELVAEVMDPHITKISVVNKLHPHDDVLATGSSRSLFIWRPKKKIVVCDRDENQSRKPKIGGESNNSDDEKSNPNSSK